MTDAYVVGDALECLSRVPDESVDLVITDPPYDSLEKWRNQGTTARLQGQWFDVVDSGYLHGLMVELYRVLRKGTHAYVFCDYHTNVVLYHAARDAGFIVKKSLIWEKVGKEVTVSCPSCGSGVLVKQGLGSPGMGVPYRSCYETIFFVQKGPKARVPDDRGVRDVLRFPRVPPKGAWPTQKPVELIDVLVRQSSLPGGLVLDPFAGSGSTLVSAARNGRKYVGIDKDPSARVYFEGRPDRPGAVPNPFLPGET